DVDTGALGALAGDRGTREVRDAAAAVQADPVIRRGDDAAGIDHRPEPEDPDAILAADDAAVVGDQPAGINCHAVGLAVDGAAVADNPSRTRQEHPGTDPWAATNGADRFDQPGVGDAAAAADNDPVLAGNHTTGTHESRPGQVEAEAGRGADGPAIGDGPDCASRTIDAVCSASGGDLAGAGDAE